MSRLCYLLKNNSIPTDMDEGEVAEAILAFVRPILAELNWAAKEPSVSHVLRSIICLLAGIPVVSEKRGKASKHQHSVALSQPLESMLVPGACFIDQECCFTVPEAFHGI